MKLPFKLPDDPEASSIAFHVSKEDGERIVKLSATEVGSGVDDWFDNQFFSYVNLTYTQKQKKRRDIWVSVSLTRSFSSIYQEPLKGDGDYQPLVANNNREFKLENWSDGPAYAHTWDAEGREDNFSSGDDESYFYGADWVYPIHLNITDPEVEDYWVVLEISDKEPIEYAVGGDAGKCINIRVGTAALIKPCL
jgi:hypothetical protein